MKTTEDVITAINAHANMVDALIAKNGHLPNAGDRSAEAQAFRNSRKVYANAVDVLDTWERAEDRGDGIYVLVASDGERVLYTPTGDGLERLELMHQEGQAAPETVNVSEFATINDARNWVVKSGMISWDWGTADSANYVESLLPDYLYLHYGERMNEVLRKFIANVLNLDPDDFISEEA
jgi:alpha-amylase/alpha-mannosidase (GH57 family)